MEAGRRESSEIHARGVRHGLPPTAPCCSSSSPGWPSTAPSRASRLTLMVSALHLQRRGSGQPSVVIVQLVPSILITPYLGAITNRARATGCSSSACRHRSQHGGPGGGHRPGAPPVHHLRPRAGHEPRALGPAAGAGGAAARHRAHAARAHRRQRRLQLDGERQRAHRAGAHRRAPRRRRPRAWRPPPSPPARSSAPSSSSASPGPGPWPSAARASPDGEVRSSVTTVSRVPAVRTWSASFGQQYILVGPRRALRRASPLRRWAWAGPGRHLNPAFGAGGSSASPSPPPWSRAAAWRRRSSPASSRRRSPSDCSASSRPWPAPSCCSPSPASAARCST